MTISTKKIIASTLVALGLVLLFGFVGPALISAKDSIAVTSGFALLTIVAVSGVIFVRNLLGMKPSNDEDDQQS